MPGFRNVSKVLAVMCLVVGPAVADHVDSIALVTEGLPPVTLEAFDACVIGPDGERPFGAMSRDCQALFEPCAARLHIAGPAAVDADGLGPFFKICAEQDSTRFYRLLLDHTLDVLALLPAGASEDDRSALLTRLVRVPEDAGTARAIACVEAAGGMTEAAILWCARDIYFLQLVESRLAVWRERP